jgi:hypothetical protein
MALPPITPQTQYHHTYKPWLADGGSHHHICAEKAAISDYVDFTDGDTQELIVDYLYNKTSEKFHVDLHEVKPGWTGSNTRKHTKSLKNDVFTYFSRTNLYFSKTR